MLEVRLFPGIPGGRRARLGAITGAVEETIDPDASDGLAVLLDRLFVPDTSTTIAPGCAIDLAVADHDRLAAALYCHNYGTTVESTVRCRKCGRDFDLKFDLETVSRQASPRLPEDVSGPDDRAMFSWREKVRFRLPTLRDQIATRDLPLQAARLEMLRQCSTAEIDDEETINDLEHAMEAVGPLISKAISADCPHCHHHEESIPFSIQQFLLDALTFERRFLTQEVHCLARTYGWSRREILDMPASERRHYASMILAEA